MGKVGDQVKKEEIDFNNASHGGTLLPPKDAVISDATLEKLLKDGALKPEPKSDLLPQANSDPVLQDPSIPVYKFSNTIMRANRPEAQLMHTKEGKPYILVNEAYNKIEWDESEIKKTLPTEAQKRDDVGFNDLTKSDDFLSQIREKNAAIENYEKINGKDPKLDAQLKEGKEEEQRYIELTTSIAQKAKEMGIGGTEFLVLNNQIMDGKVVNSDGDSDITQEGKGRVYADKNALLNALKSDQGTENLKGILEHELGHIQHGDPSAAGQIRDRDPQIKRYDESRADLGVDDPQNLEKWFKKDLEKRIPDYLKENPKAVMSSQYKKTGIPTDYDLKQVSDWDGKPDDNHPVPSDRINALQDAAEVRKEYEKTHTVVTDADREAESRFVIAKVEQDMNGLWTKSQKVSNAPLPPDVPATVLPKGTIDPNSVPHIELNVSPSKGAAETQPRVNSSESQHPNASQPADPKTTSPTTIVSTKTDTGTQAKTDGNGQASSSIEPKVPANANPAQIQLAEVKTTVPPEVSAPQSIDLASINLPKINFDGAQSMKDVSVNEATTAAPKATLNIPAQAPPTPGPSV